MLNEVRLIGRLKDDPVVDVTSRGDIKSSFVLVLDRPRYDPTLNTAVLVTIYIGCVAWHLVGEKIGNDYRKGDLLLVMGELDQQQETGPRGGTQTKTRVNILTATPLRLLPRAEIQ